MQDETPFEKVVLSSTCPCTSTWSLAKPNKQPSYGCNWLGENCRLLNVTQNIISTEFPWSMRNQCTLLPTVTTEITTGSSSCETTSSKSALVKQRSGSAGWLEPRASTIITSLVYFWRSVHAAALY